MSGVGSPFSFTILEVGLIRSHDRRFRASEVELNSYLYAKLEQLSGEIQLCWGGPERATSILAFSGLFDLSLSSCGLENKQIVSS